MGGAWNFPPQQQFSPTMISEFFFTKRASQEEQISTNFSFIAPSTVE